MATTVPAREYHTRQTHFIRQTFTYSDNGISAGTLKWRNGLPPNAFVTGTKVYVHAAFNAATTNVFTVGTNGTTANNIVASADVNEASAQMFNVEGVGVLDTSAALDIYTKFTQTGTAATTGKATVVIFYAPQEEPYR